MIPNLKCTSWTFLDMEYNPDSPFQIIGISEKSACY